jgi:Mrp family chromosome partitioning ATPase
LIIDTPPGTSDEHISIVQYLKASNIVDAIVVTTPQEISMADVRKELNFCKKTGLNVIGVVENMADFRVPMNSIEQSKNKIRLLSSSSSSDVTEEMLAKIKLHCPELLECTISAPLFSTTDSDSNNNHGPEQMAQKFNVPYLGKLPMDPNMMIACERGESFIETFPTSAASGPFKEIVQKIINYYDNNNTTSSST